MQHRVVRHSYSMEMFQNLTPELFQTCTRPGYINKDCWSLVTPMTGWIWLKTAKLVLLNCIKLCPTHVGGRLHGSFLWTFLSWSHLWSSHQSSPSIYEDNLILHKEQEFIFFTEVVATLFRSFFTAAPVTQTLKGSTSCASDVLSAL